MNILIQLIVLVYMFAIFPILLGLLENRIEKKKNISSGEICARGYFLMFALFMLIAFPMVKLGITLSRFAGIWLILSVVLTVAAGVFCRRDILRCVAFIAAFWKNGSALKKAVIVGFFLLMLGSVLFVKPHVSDYTVAIVDTALVTDSMYGYHPYTNTAYGMVPTANAYSPIEMLYAVISYVTRMEPTLLIQFFLPVFLLSWFLVNYWQIGKILFGDSEEKNVVFMVLVVILHLSPLYIENQALAAGIFRNSWNGQTLLGCVALPGIFLWGLKLQKRCQNDLPWKLSEILGWIWQAGVLLLAAQLFYIRGLYYGCMVLLLWVAVILVGKGYRRYGIAFKNH